jgi:hypothetical protein
MFPTRTILLIPVVLLLSGCGDHREATVYTIPAEESAPVQPMPMASAPMDMASRQLPESALNQDGPRPEWEVPGTWRDGRASSMRHGSYAAGETGREVDIAITSFPGDVGGLLANINRWRGQIDLPQLDAAELEDSVERAEVYGKPVIVTGMTGPALATRAAIFEHAGNSWFVKMTGPIETVRAETDTFNQFIQTFRFPSEPTTP